VPEKSAGPIDVSYTRDPSSVLFWEYLVEQVKDTVKPNVGKKRTVKLVMMHPHLDLEAYREPRGVAFTTTDDINCLRSNLGQMIGICMADIP
jgi:hypothetical protein